MLKSVTMGRAGTAMQAFSNTLSQREIELVVDFIRQEFMISKATNTKYHTVANGWPNHERYRIAYPFVLGEVALDTKEEDLNAVQQQGKYLFMNSCVSCHDRAKVKREGSIWEPRAVSYPRNGFSNKQKSSVPKSNDSDIDSDTSASPYQRHEKMPVIENLSQQQQLGESLFQDNCAFCHAPDGTGKNWIGSFLESHPRNLTDASVMKNMSQQDIKQVIRDGLPGTTMSAWKNVLNDQQIDAVVAYIKRAFFPQLKSE